MVALVSGSNLGLFNHLVLGNGAGSKVGQGNNQVFLNAATGNLILQQHSNELSALGLDTQLTQTYNSQGQHNDARSQSWLLNQHRYLTDLPEKATVGSKLRRANGDGSFSEYHFDSEKQEYISTDGSGAHDQIRFDEAKKLWIWQEGTSGVVEHYNSDGQLVSRNDRDGHLLNFSYENNLLSRITDASGQQTTLSYIQVSGKTLLSQIATSYVNDQGKTQETINQRFEYDLQGRLSAVIIDLTPEDNTIADGNIFRTDYQYDGNSLRIKQVEQSDGVIQQFTYKKMGEQYRIVRIEDGKGVGVTLDYNTTQRLTSVRNDKGETSFYRFDEQDRLTSITQPAVNHQRPVLSYTYDDAGNITSVTDAKNQVTQRQYDDAGNLLTEIIGNQVNYFRYNENNQIIAKANYTLAKPGTIDDIGHLADLPENAAITRMVYDQQGHLRYTISAEGRIQAWDYNAQGLMVEHRVYSNVQFSLADYTAEKNISLSAIDTFLNAQPQAQYQRITNDYDARGMVARITQWTGNQAQQKTHYIYSAFGQLLKTINDKGVVEQFTYDGLGRVLSKEKAGQRLSTVQYNDAQQAIVTTTANGLSTTQVFDSAGRLVTESTVATDETVTGKQRLFYDEAGRLVAKEAADGARSYLFYNEAGRKAGTIDETGKVTRFSYDANGLLIATREYSTRVDTSALVAQQGEVNLKLMKLTAWLPAESAADRSSYAIYDAQGREQYTIDAEGFVTETIYNAQGKQVAKHRYEQPLSSEQLINAANYSASDINRLIGGYSYVLMDNTTWTTDRQPDQPYAYTSSALLQHRELHAYEDVLKLSGERVNRNPVQPYPVQTGYDYTLRSVQKAGAQTLQLVGARTSEQPMVKVEGQAQPIASPAISLALTREGALAKLTLLSTEFSANKSNAADYWQGDQRFIKPTDRGFEITQPGRKNTASAVKSNSSSRYLTAKGYHFKTDVTLSDTTGLFSLAIKADNRKQHMLRLISGNTVALIGLGAGGIERQLNKEPYTKGETYTIEFEVNADSSTVYFYPKGKTRAEGFSQRLENHGFKSVNVELIVGKSRTNNDQRVDLTHFQEKGQLALDNYQLRYRVAGTENFTPVSLNEEQEFAWNNWPEGQAYELELTDKETGKVYLAQTTGTAETLQFKPEQDNTAPATSGVFINNMVPKGQWTHYQQITTKVFNAEGQLVGEGTISPADFAEYQGQIKIGDQLLSAGQYQLEIIFTDNRGKQLTPLSMDYQVGNTDAPIQQSLQWASPKQAGELDALRVRKAGSDDWQTLTITQDALGKNKADLTSLALGQYEYQINYLNNDGQMSYQLTGSIDTTRSGDTTHSGITSVEAEAESITYQQVHNKYDVLQGVISAEEQQNLEKIDCTTYRDDGRYPLAENTITIDDWVNFKSDVTLLPHHVNNRPLLKNGEGYRVEINLHYKDGTVVTKAPIEFEFGDDFYTVNQTLRWPVIESYIPFTEHHEFSYRVNDGSKGEFISVPVVREGNEFVVQLTGLIPGEGYEYRIKHLDDQLKHSGVGEYNVKLWGIFSPKLGQSTKNIHVSYDRVISEPDDSGALTGVISSEEATLIDSVQVTVRQEQADGSEEILCSADTYISSYENYQGEVNLGMPGGLKPGKYNIIVQKFYRNGEVKYQDFTYEIGAQPQLNKTHRLRIPVANLPVDINQPNVQLSYRLKQLGEAFTAIDVNSIRSADGQYLELNLDQSREAAYDFDLKIVSDQGEFQGRASVILDANTDGNYLLKFGDKLGNDIAGRFTHRLYSQDGLLVGELDAEGFLVEHRYDAAGQKISTTRYANATGYPSKQQLFLDINTLRPEVSVNDQTTHFIYDDLGQHVATVDAEGYLTETVYDSLGQVVQIIGYRQRINYQQQTLTELRVLAIGSEPNRVEHHEYDDRGRLIKQTAANGLVTHNEYDVMGNLITVTQGQASDHSQIRYQTKRYDQLGRVTAELTATGAKQLAVATTDAEREIIWQKQATLFSYNERGWLISKTYPEVNALENGQNKSHLQHLTQWFFYNKGGQLRFSISSQGAVNELRYNTLGEKIASIDYATALPINNALTGGLASTELSEKIKGIANSEQDQVTHFEYNKRGLLAKSTTASGSVSQYQYNSFGEVSQLAKSIQAANNQFQIASFEYDLRGLAITKTLSVEGLTESGLRQTETITYDAFQRKTKVQQGEFIRQQFSYNRLNQLVSEFNAAGDTTQVAYDAFGRKVSITDRQGNTTTYHYDDQQHQLKVVSATGEQLITQYDQFGEKAALIDAVGTRTEYHYDEAGRVQQVTQHSADGELLKTVEQHEYNTLGWKQKTVAANGLVTTYQYDVAGKLLRQTVDPEGKAQVTSHEVDVRGRVIKTTTPNGVQTLTAYDAEGRVRQITRQAGEQQRITRYRYDEQGNKVAEQTYSASVVNGQQSELKLWRETHYHYDGLGRLQAKIVDPSGLAQTTRYQYDEQNNLIAETNSLGQTTYHAYNTDNQRIYSVDAEGGVTLVKYTKTGQVWLTEQLAKPINTEGLEFALKQAREPRVVIEQCITDRSSPQQTEHNHRSYTLYDADGRKAMTIDNLGGVTEFVYNSRGALAQTIRYTQRLSDIQQLAEAQDLAATKAQVRAATTDDKPTYTQTTLFDQLGQARFIVDANGSLTEKQYDISGQVVRELKYDLAAVEALKLDKVNLLELSDQQLEAKLQAWLTASETTESGETVEHQLNYQQTDYIYNQLGQTCFTIDAAGYINRLSYDQAGQVVASYRYQQPLSSELRQGGRLGQPLALAQLTEYVAEHNATVEAKQYVYDAAGRKRFEIDSMGYVTAFSYDALDQLLSTTRYTQPISFDPSPTEASVNQATQKLHGVSTRQHYDALGRTLLEIDALGHVTAHEYDALGQLRRTVRYAQALDEGLRNGSTAEIAARLSGLSHAQDQATVYRYDAAGHKTALITGAASAVTLGLSEDQLQAGLASGQLRAERYEYDALGQRTVLRQATAEGDFRTLFYYDSKGQLTRELKQVNAEQGYLTVFDYDAFGNKIFENRYSGLLPMALGANQSRSLVYSDRIVRFRYDALNRLVAETVPSADGNGHETQYQYDAFGNLTLKTEAAGMQAERRTAYRYDERNQKIAEITALGTEAAAETQYWYDALGRVSAIIDARGVALVQDDSDWALAERARLGIVNTITTADGQTQPGGAKRAHELTEEDIATLQAAYTSEQTFDAAGRKIAERDPLGHETHTVYDAFGNIIKATDPRGQVGYFFYDANNRLRLQIDPKGYATETRYDAFGQVVSTYQYQQVLDLSGGAITEQSDLTALISQLQAPVDSGSGSASDKVIVQQHTLNAFGQILSTTQAGVTTTFSYDAQGNKITATDGNGHTTHYAYDAQGRLIEETSPEVRVVTDVEQGVVSTQVVVTRHQYDQLGNKTQTIVGANSDQPRVTEFRYNAQGQLIQQRQSAHVVEGQPRPQVASVNRQYDAVGNLIRETDANGQVTTLYYNARNQLIAQVDGDGVLKTFGYDAAGNRLSERTYDQRLATQTLMLHTPPEGQGEYRETHFEYDANNRELARYSREVLMHDIDRGYFYGRVGHTQVYDANGNVIKTTDSRGHSTYTFFDAKGQAILLVDASGYATQRQYDAAGHIVEELKYAQALPDSARNNLSIDSDPQALLTELDASHADNRITRNQYDALGRLVLTRQVGVSHQVKGTDATGNTVWQTQQGDAITEMFYDANGNNVAIIRRNSGNQAERIDLQYDALNRKVLEQGAEYTAANGNTVRQTTSTYYTAQGDTALSVKEAADGQQTAFNLGAQDLITRQVYDNAGHMIKQIDANGAVTELFYDAKGQVLRKRQHLQQADGSQQAVEVRFGYDSQGREIWRDEGVGAIQRTHYNSHGEISGKGINDQVHEYYEYNAAGQLFKTNKKNGAPQVFVYDANGNASLEIQSMTIDLKAVTLSQLRLLDAKQLHITLSRYDARNQLIDVVQPEMTFLTKASSSSAGTEVIDATPYTFGEAKMTGGEKFDFNFLLFARAAGKHWPRCYFRQDAVEITWSDIGEYDGDLLIEWDSGYRWDTKGSFVVKASQGRHTINMWGKDNTTSVWYLKNMGFKYQVKISKKNEAGDWVLLTEQTGRYRWSGFAPRWKHDTLVRWERNHVEMPKLLTLKEQPRQATRLRMYYRPAQEPGYTSRAYDEANYQPGKYTHSVDGARMNREGDWALDLTNAPGLSANQAYEYYYEALTPEGTVINRGEGIFRTTQNAKHGETFDLRFGLQQQAATAAANGEAAKPSQQTLNDLQLRWANLGGYQGKLKFDWNAGFGEAKGSETVDASAGQINLQPNVSLENAEGRTFTYTVNVYKQNAQGQWELLDWLQGDYSFAAERGDSGEFSAKAHHQLSRFHALDQGSVTHRNTGRPAYTKASLDYVIGDGLETSHSIHRTQRFNAFGEVIEEVDGLGNSTTFRYNQLGQMVTKQAPETEVTDEQGQVHKVRPTTHYGYDLLGQQITTTDANGNINEQQWAAGQIIAERHADGGQVQMDFDAFGRKVSQTNELGEVTQYHYDRAGNVTRVERAGGNIDQYTYDAAGQRLTHTNALGHTERYQYDSKGRIIAHHSYGNMVTQYSYRYEASIGGIGGWVVTKTDGNKHTLVDHRDAFDRIHYHKDLGDRTFTYGYNASGKLAWQKGDTVLKNTSKVDQEIYYGYYNNGYIKNIDDVGANNYAEFKYDKNGNLIFEGYSNKDAKDGYKDVYTQHSTVEYDSLNRIKKIVDAKYTIAYQYDAMGNRRRVHSRYQQVNGEWHNQDFWYTYDAMNRFTTTMGTLKDGQITPGDHGYRISYNLAGQRVTATNKQHTERYHYDGNGKLTETYIDDTLRAKRINDAVGNTTTYLEYDQESNVYRQVNKVYDQDNRATRETTSIAKGKAQNKGSTYQFDGAGNLSSTETFGEDVNVRTNYTYERWDDYKQKTIKNEGLTNEEFDFPWRPGMSILHYDVNGHVNMAEDKYNARILRYVNNHKGQILTRTEEGHDRNDDHKAYLRTHHFYYVNGIGIGDVGDDGPTYTDYATQLAYNQGLMRKPDKTEPVFSADFDANFQAIGENYPAQSPGGYTVQQGDTLQTIALALWGDSSLWFMLADANGLQPQQLKDLKPGTFLTVPNKVTNIHNNSSTFRPYNAGVAIGDVSPTLPDMPPPPIKPAGGGCGGAATIVIAVVAIAATIFTAGAAGAAMAAAGSTAAAAGATVAGTMSLGAGVLAGSAGIGFAATATAAFAGGVVGSLAGQMAGVAMGVQDGISFKQALKSGVTTAISAGVGHGLGQLAKASPAAANIIGTSKGVSNWQAVARAGISNLAVQGVQQAIGYQKKFDWRSTAASVISTGISRNINGQSELNPDSGQWEIAQEEATRAATSALVEEAVASKIYGRKFEFANVASSAITGAIKGHFSTNWQFMEQRQANSRILQEQAVKHKQASLAKSNVGVIEEQKGSLERKTTKSLGEDISSASLESDGGLPAHKIDEIKRRVDKQFEKMGMKKEIWQASNASDSLQNQLGGRLDALPEDYERLIAENGGSLPSEWISGYYKPRSMSEKLEAFLNRFDMRLASWNKENGYSYSIDSATEDETNFEVKAGPIEFFAGYATFIDTKGRFTFGFQKGFSLSPNFALEVGITKGITKFDNASVLDAAQGVSISDNFSYQLSEKLIPLPKVLKKFAKVRGVEFSINREFGNTKDKGIFSSDVKSFDGYSSTLNIGYSSGKLDRVNKFILKKLKVKNDVMQKYIEKADYSYTYERGYNLLGEGNYIELGLFGRSINTYKNIKVFSHNYLEKRTIDLMKYMSTVLIKEDGDAGPRN